MEQDIFRARGGLTVRGRGWRRWTRAVMALGALRPGGMASLQADRDFVAIDSPLSSAMVSRTHVISVELYAGPSYDGILFRSDDDDCDVIFWSSQPESVIDGLLALGWEVAGYSAYG